MHLNISEEDDGLLADVEGIEVHIDIIPVYGREVHDQRLHQVLQQLEKKGLTLNSTKCLFHKSRLNSLVISLTVMGSH